MMVNLKVSTQLATFIFRKYRIDDRWTQLLKVPSNHGVLLSSGACLYKCGAPGTVEHFVSGYSADGSDVASVVPRRFLPQNLRERAWTQRHS